MTFTTIDDFYVSETDLHDSNPSIQKDGVPVLVEQGLRHYGCCLIWQACHCLELPTTVACTAQVLFHRFYCKNSMGSYDVRVMGASVLWMACKLEEVLACDDVESIRLRDVLMVFYDCIMRANGNKDKSMMLNLYSGFYSSFKDEVIKAERDMLRCFGFVTHVEHAHPLVLAVGSQLGLPRTLLQSACNIVNDSLRTTLCVRFKAENVACAALFLAAQKHGHTLPYHWWKGCDVNWESLRTCCDVIIDLYENHAGLDKYVCLSKSFLDFNSGFVRVGGESSDKADNVRDMNCGIDDLCG